MIVITEIEDWEKITKNRRLLHYLKKQNFKCACGCDYHFKTEDKIGKEHWSHSNYPHIAHRFERTKDTVRPNLKKDINCVMRLECHAKQHFYKYGWMRKMK